MSTRNIATGFGLVTLLVMACEVHHHEPWPHDDCYYDHSSPSVPRGVYSVTGDGWVRVYWEPVADNDLNSYGVYWNDAAEGYYERIAHTSGTSYRVDGLSNGRTYYFAVDAWDVCGNSSDLSYETVFDTPRPAGYGLRVWEISQFPEESAIDFSNYAYGSQSMVVPWDDSHADILLERDGDMMFLTATEQDTDVLYWGRAESLDEIDIAPETGWVAGGSLAIAQSHAYLVWTWDNRFAKILVTRVSDSSITFDWAYQTDEGNPELCPAPDSQAKLWIAEKTVVRGDGVEGRG